MSRAGERSVIAHLLPICLAVAFFGFVFAFSTFRREFQFDTDEGIELMRAMLVEQGHPLYTRVVSDQPPILTHLLVMVFRLAGDLPGDQLGAARVLVMFFAALIVWAASRTALLLHGSLAAILVPLFILMTPSHVYLSASVMVGIPSLALAMTSLALVLEWHRNRRRAWLVLSGLALGLAVMTKLYQGLFAPMLILGIAGDSLRGHIDAGAFRWKRLLPVGIWFGAFCAIILSIATVGIGWRSILNLLAPHVAAASVKGQGSAWNWIVRLLMPQWPMLLVAVIGCLAMLARGNRRILYLSVGLLYLVAFSAWRPVFYHHMPQILIPASIAAAVGLAEAARALLAPARGLGRGGIRQEVLAVLAVGASLLAVPHGISVLRGQILQSPSLEPAVVQPRHGPERKLLRAVRSYNLHVYWMVTNRKMYAFMAGIPVPPELGTFSGKELRVGALNDAQIAEVAVRYEAGLVMVAGNFPNLQRYLDEEYTLAHAEADLGLDLYARRDVVSSP